jgi:MFS family permease
MAFEIIGSRMLGPYAGTSVAVWTSIIGVMLLCLSLGYYFGGRISDRMPRADILSFLIFIASVVMLFSAFLKETVIMFLLDWFANINLMAIAASLVLFSVPSVLLGMVSPFAARIKIKSIGKSGAVAGKLYAVSTIGSILGVFVSGFYLIPAFPLKTILFFLSLTLMVCSLYLNMTYRIYLKSLKSQQ